MSALESYVDEILAPIRASRRRKARMREELLAHATSILSEETGRTVPSNSASMERALARLGSPTDVRSALQTSVPHLERILAIKVLERRPLESIYAYSFRVSRWFAEVTLFYWVCAVLTDNGPNLFFGPGQASQAVDQILWSLPFLVLQPTAVFLHCFLMLLTCQLMERDRKRSSPVRPVLYASLCGIGIALVWRLIVEIVYFPSEWSIPFKADTWFLGPTFGVVSCAGLLLRHFFRPGAGGSDNIPPRPEHVA